MPPSSTKALSHKPRTSYEPYPFSYKTLLISPEVWLSAIANLVLLYLLMFATSEVRLLGPRGLWLSDGKAEHHELNSRDAEEKHQLPHGQKVSTDILLTFLGVLTVNSLIQACCRVVMKEKARFEKEDAERQDLAAKADKPENEQSVVSENKEKESTGETDDKTTAKDTNIEGVCEEQSTSTSSSQTSASKTLSASLSATVSATSEVSPQTKKYFNTEIIVNIIMALGVFLALLCAVCVQLQIPNEFRGFGAVLMTFVVVGALITAGFSKNLLTLMHFCGIVQNVALWVFLFLIGRAALREHKTLPFVSDINFWWN